MKKYYITTPIYYPSGKFHIGTAYTEVLADMLTKYHKLKGYNTFMLTGLDEHGQKIENKAIAANMTPKEYVDKQAEAAIKLWNTMHIDYNKFIRTTDKYHEEAVQEIFEKLLSQGDIYKGHYEGWYCEPCESYFTDFQLVDGKCPDCGREVKKMKEEAYFFNMKKYADRLLEYYSTHDEFIKPNYRKIEMINNFIKPGLEDLCVTRTSFKWGVPVKSDQKHVIYVWLDALTNYITAIGYNSESKEQFNQLWPADLHIVGKDIARFHLIYWPIFLMALKLPLPKQILVHNWIMMKNGKMSKSVGNVIYPESLIERYGLDATKYYLIRQMPSSSDGIFTPEEFIKRYNNDLVNDLSNLLNRTISMANKYFQGNVTTFNGNKNEEDQEYREAAQNTVKELEEKIINCEFADSLQTIWNFISKSNKYIDETKPWELAKDETKQEELKSVIYHLIAGLRHIAILINPLLQETSKNILRQIGINEEPQWKTLFHFEKMPETQVINQGEPIFMRLNEPEEIAYIQELMQK